MSIRSTIGIIDSKGKEKRIYCNYDGFLNGVGRTLLISWNTPTKINKLMDFGNISLLKPYPNVVVVGKSSDDEYPRRYIMSVDLEKNYIDAQNVGGTFRKKEEFNYLWKNGQWWVEFVDEDGENKNLPLRNVLLGFEGHKTSVPIYSKKFSSVKKRNIFPIENDCSIKINFRKMI